MKIHVVLAVYLLCTVILLSGCQETQSSERMLRLDAIEQTQTEMAATLDRHSELVGVKLGKVQKDIQLLEEHLQQNKEQIARLSTLPEKLVANADADRIYMKTIRDNMGSIRTQTAKIVRIQNQRISEERMVYAQLMEQEIDVLSVRLAQMRQIAERLRNASTDVDKELELATSIISGEYEPQAAIARER
ncbi:MAG: hypothetical protein IH892_12265 [Planctomycetes bacterium]|nr:hypothetical protein [Planctomycetota bacterium]